MRKAMASGRCEEVFAAMPVALTSWFTLRIQPCSVVDKLVHGRGQMNLPIDICELTAPGNSQDPRQGSQEM